MTAVLFSLFLLRPVLETTFVIQVFGIALVMAAWSVTGGVVWARAFLAILTLLTVGLVFLSVLKAADSTRHSLDPLSLCLILAYLGLLCYCGIVLLVSLLRKRHVLLIDVLGAVSLYLILGYIWAFVYTSLELLHPNSFSGIEFSTAIDGDRLSTTFSDLSYFSFITLATQGYGDITPLSAWAETFVMLETVVGQLYVALVLAYLLSVHLNMGGRELSSGANGN